MLSQCIFLQADAGGSPSLVARGLAASQVAAATEQIEIQVQNEKVSISLAIIIFLCNCTFSTQVYLKVTGPGWFNHRQRWGNY